MKLAMILSTPLPPRKGTTGFMPKIWPSTSSLERKITLAIEGEML